MRDMLVGPRFSVCIFNPHMAREETEEKWAAADVKASDVLHMQRLWHGDNGEPSEEAEPADAFPKGHDQRGGAAAGRLSVGFISRSAQNFFSGIVSTDDFFRKLPRGKINSCFFIALYVCVERLKSLYLLFVGAVNNSLKCLQQSLANMKTDVKQRASFWTDCSLGHTEPMKMHVLSRECKYELYLSWLEI